MIKTYTELITFPTFEERFEYLKFNSSIGKTTFGFERYLNQKLYQSREWKRARRDVIVRDKSCDLAFLDRETFGSVIIHHINPITVEDIERGHACLFDLDNLVCVTSDTHNALHYGDISLIPSLPTERRKGDTCPWKVF